MKKLISALSISLCLLSITYAQASTILFDDPTIFWPGFENTDSTIHHGKTPNKSDYWGVPDIINGSFTFDGSKLTGISLDYKYYESGGDLVAPGDWFFDTNNDSYWDYVLTSSSRDSGNLQAIREVTNWDIYSVHLEYNPSYDTDSYIMSYSTDGIPRKDHPALANIANGEHEGSAYFSSWISNPVNFTNYTSTWNDFSIDFGSSTQFTYGFAMTCANDVLYATNVPIPNPEPGTALLLGLGLLGLGAMARRRR